MTPRILVLMATYNGEAWVIEQVESILGQEDVSVQLLIGDDNSTDSTIELVRDCFGSDSRLNIVKWPHSSGSAGANFRRLIDFSDLENIDYVSFSDQDDIWLPRKLISAVKFMAYERASGYSCSVQSFSHKDKTKILTQSRNLTKSDFLFEGAGQGCTFLLDVDFFRRVQLFCRVYSEEVKAAHYHDWLVYFLARTWSLRWVFDERPMMRYRQHAANEIGARDSIGAIKRRLMLISNGWYKDQVATFLKLHDLANGIDSFDLNRFKRVFFSPNSFGRRIKISFYLIKYGRRRVIDRCVLAFSGLCGWL